jgi:hypothetical protein
MKFYPKIGQSIADNDHDLIFLANLYGTDKGDMDEKTTHWYSKCPNHKTMGYAYTYEKYMSSKRNTNVSLLEIGINDWRFPYASTKMWLKYFKNINLYSMDNFWNKYLPEKEIYNINNMGANFIYADQGSENDWNDIKNMLGEEIFDFVVEDGSHQPNHMMFTLYESCDLIKSGGYYFMEDIQSLSLPKYYFDNYDHSILTKEIIESYKNKKIISQYLTDHQLSVINDTYSFIELILDKQDTNYLAVLQKK